jgi:tetratricopeptide (TPR) repeat protein
VGRCERRKGIPPRDRTRSEKAKAHPWYATFLHDLVRHDEALTEIDRARELAPDSSSILADQGILLWGAGYHEQLLQLLKQLEVAEPDFISPHLYLRFAYFETGDYPNYIVELKKDALLTHDAAQSSVAEVAAKGFIQGSETRLVRSTIFGAEEAVQIGEVVTLLWGADRGSTRQQARSDHVPYHLRPVA